MYVRMGGSSVIIVIWPGSNYISGVALCFFRLVFIYSRVGPRIVPYKVTKYLRTKAFKSVVRVG